MSSTIQNKLFSYEHEPPSHLWNKIDEALDSGVSNPFAQKLHQYKQDPPEALWGKIVTQFDSTEASNQAPVVPFYKRYRRSTHLAGATAAIFLVVIITNLLIGKKTISEQPHLDISNNKDLSKAASKPRNTPAASTISKSNTVITSGISFRKPDHEVIRFTTGDHFKVSPINEAGMFSSSSYISPDVLVKNVQLPTTLKSGDKYMIYIDGNGNPFRLPRKLYSALVCPTEDASCRERLKQLQQNIATATANSDFSGLLDMLNNLKENQ